MPRESRVRTAEDGTQIVHCAGCEAWLSPDAFRRDDRMKCGYTSYCRECKRQRNRKSYARDPEVGREKMTERHLLRTYGIGLATFARMAAQQEGVCAICGQPETAIGRHGERKRLAVDHCHATGRVRGLLCQRCNMLLGWLETRVISFRRFLEYLQSDRDYRKNQEQGHVEHVG